MKLEREYMTVGNRIFIGVFTTYKTKGRCDIIEETWAKNLSIDDDIKFFTDRTGIGPNHIFCTITSNHLSHRVKHIYAMLYGNNNIDKYDWFFFIGDDNYVFVKNLKQKVLELSDDESICYGQIANTHEEDRGLHYPLGGAGHLFSAAALKRFNERNPDMVRQCQRYHDSDVYVGYGLQNAGMKTVNLGGLFSQNPEFYGINNPEEYICFHYIKSKKDFENLYKRETNEVL